jgi:trans-2,3-dihydro-3-hydroxyanthranilate isomerase
VPFEYHIADVFTDKPFGGNQLAVLTDARGLSTEQMQAIAREFNFSETTFVLPSENAKNTRKVRIFTPAAELPFAGHPTVGTAHVLAETGAIKLDGDETRIVFEEGVGEVPVLIKSRNGKPYFAQLTAARIPERHSSPTSVEVLAQVLSLEAGDIISDSALMPEAASVGLPFFFIPLKSLDALARSQVRKDVWERALKGQWATEMFLFVETPESSAREGIRNGDGEFRARMYAPALGVGEDPATGSAAAAFGGYLAARTEKRDGTLTWHIDQGVEMGRPSHLEVEVDVADGEVNSVRVGGASVLISSGRLLVP